MRSLRIFARRWPWLVALWMLLFTTPALAGEEPLVPPKDDAELAQRLQAILAEHKIAGMSVVIADRRGTRWIAGLGKANVATGAAATPDTLFRVGSISKMFVALAALKLEGEGKLSLDAGVRALAPEVKFENPWEATDPVRVVHLLEHTSGWDDVLLREWAYSDPRPATLKEGLDYDPRSRTSRWRPGTRHSYTNSGPAVVAYVIEKVTGRVFEEYVAETFLKPLGMTTASFLLTPETEQRLTRLYRDDGVTEYPYFHFLMRPSGSLNASAREMSAFLRFLVNRGSVGDVALVPPAALERMETPATYWGARAGLKVGYGLHNASDLMEDGLVWHGHNGGLEGARAVLSYLPDPGVGFFYAINGDDDGAFRELTRLLRATVARDVKRPEPPPVVKAAAGSGAYTGWYAMDNPRNEYTHFVVRLVAMAHAEADDDGLHVKALFRKLRGDYVPVTPTLYRRLKDPVASVALLPDGPEGRIIQTTGATLKAIPTWMAWTQLLVVGLGLVVMVTTPLFALVWIPRKLAGRMKAVKHVSARLWPLLAVLALAGAGGIYMQADDLDLGHRGVRSVAFTACTLIFAVCSVGSLVHVARVPRREVNLAAHLHTWLAAVVLTVVTLYLLYWGILGIRLWA
jgi:CubicO group peptidase (beta-lactamase class C family)